MSLVAHPPPLATTITIKCGGCGESFWTRTCRLSDQCKTKLFRCRSLSFIFSHPPNYNHFIRSNQSSSLSVHKHRRTKTVHLPIDLCTHLPRIGTCVPSATHPTNLAAAALVRLKSKLCRPCSIHLSNSRRSPLNLAE